MNQYRNVSILLARGLAAALLLVLVVVLAAFSPALAAGYPEKPIRWVVPSTPGGGTDTTTRIIAPKLSEILGQPVVIENRPGASGNVGAAFVAKTPPDGYTLVTCIASHASNAALMTNVPFDLVRDFAPVSLLVTLPNVMVGNPSLQPKTVKELIAYAKANPGKMQYSSGGLGSIQHMTMELFQNMTGTKMLHVPYKATHPALMDAVSGYVPLTVASSLTTLPLARSGRLHAYGVTSAKRTAAAPDLPTIAEQGVPGFEAVQWFGMLAPAGTPRDIVEKLHAAVLRAMQDPEVKRHFGNEGADITPSRTPEEFGSLIRSDLAKWVKVVKEGGIQAR
ncbi:MAG: tripartite tricarboxylate transporter substrate binding protein [Thermodesulfobacteriota bacterium]